EQLHQAQPQNVNFKNGLAVAYYKLGQHQQDHGEGVPAALSHYQQAAKLWSELVQDAPQFAEFQRNHEFIQNRIAELAKK
ncbi:MAG: hypothetical protein AAGJ82_16085, partial [Bacteroidota bacterium]